MNELPQSLLLWLAVINAAGFLLMGLDKWKAKRGAWRISEKTLLTPALLGGRRGSLPACGVFTTRLGIVSLPTACPSCW